MTLYVKKLKHFYLKIYDGEHFYDFDNMKSNFGQNNEKNPDSEITYAFYEKKKLNKYIQNLIIPIFVSKL